MGHKLGAGAAMAGTPADVVSALYWQATDRGTGEDGMSEMSHDGNRALQARSAPRRLADRIEERIVHDRIDDGDGRFIERCDMFFLATADEQGRPTCSYKGGD